MVARMLNKETGVETILIEKAEYDSLLATLKDMEVTLERREAFYRLAEIELDLYKSNWLCRMALSLTLFFKKLFGGEI